MKTYTYSEARQRLAGLLDESRRAGKVQIRRRDGQVFLVQPVGPSGSPLDVPAVKAALRPGELESFVREGREQAGRFWIDRLIPKQMRNRTGKAVRK